MPPLITCGVFFVLRFLGFLCKCIVRTLRNVQIKKFKKNKKTASLYFCSTMSQQSLFIFRHCCSTVNLFLFESDKSFLSTHLTLSLRSSWWFTRREIQPPSMSSLITHDTSAHHLHYHYSHLPAVFNVENLTCSTNRSHHTHFPRAGLISRIRWLFLDFFAQW